MRRAHGGASWSAPVDRVEKDVDRGSGITVGGREIGSGARTMRARLELRYRFLMEFNQLSVDLTR